MEYPGMEMFNGFPQEGIAFLAGLRNNNEREWFNARKAIFKTALEEPAKAFVSELCERLPALSGEPVAGKIFRIYRDVRFSKDKTPYNPHIRIGFVGQGTAGRAIDPSFYFSLEPDKVIFGTGCLEFSKPGLEIYRHAVANSDVGATLEDLLANLTKSGLALDEPALKKVPRGFDADHPQADLLKHKGVTVWRETGITDDLSSPAFADAAIKQFKAMLPLYSWLTGIA